MKAKRVIFSINYTQSVFGDACNNNNNAWHSSLAVGGPISRSIIFVLVLHFHLPFRALPLSLSPEIFPTPLLLHCLSSMRVGYRGAISRVTQLRQTAPDLPPAIIRRHRAIRRKTIPPAQSGHT